MKPRAVVVSLMLVLTLGPLAWAAPSGKIVVAQGVDPTTLDPHDHEESPATSVLAHIYDTLLIRDKNLQITPWLATAYKVLNPTIWEFTLRQGVAFTNGEPFDAAAAKYSLERSANPANNLKSTILRPIARVDVVDKYTIRIVTAKPFPTLDAVLAFRGNMVPPQYFQTHDKAFLARNPVGTGAYRLGAWVKDDRLELEANTQWWRGAPRIQTVVFRPIPDETTRMAALQTGEVDIATNVPPHLIQTLRTHPKVTVSSAPSQRVIFVPIYTVQCEPAAGGWDCSKSVPGPTANPKVRQAINHAVNVDAIIQNVLEGQGIPLATPLTAKHFGYDPALKPVPYDPAKAKQLLAEAGYPNGIDLVLHSPNGRYPKDKEVAETVAGQLTQVGIRTQPKVYEWTTYMNTVSYRHGGAPMWLIGWGNPTWDADYTLTNFFRTGEVLANSGNAEITALLDAARSTMDRAQRQEIYFKVGRLLHEDAPVLSLYQQIDNYGVNRRVEWSARSDERIYGVDMTLKP